MNRRLSQEQREETFVVATGNPGKLRDFSVLLAPYGIRVRPIRELAPDFDPEETGDTFEENARIKAEAGVRLTGLPCLADDSGLCVDALDGAPGVRSARYADGHGDAANNEKLLNELSGVPRAERTARFRSVVALAFPDGRTLCASGHVEGVILEAPRGEGGFGYDPLFYLPALDRTMAELPIEEKNRISHRRRAFDGLKGILDELFSSPDEA